MAYIVMAYIVMVYIVMAYIVMAYIFMAYIVMTNIVMVYIVMAYVVMAYIGMAYIVMAYIVMVCISNLVMASIVMATEVCEDTCTGLCTGLCVDVRIDRHVHLALGGPLESPRPRRCRCRAAWMRRKCVKVAGSPLWRGWASRGLTARQVSSASRSVGVASTRLGCRAVWRWWWQGLVGVASVEDSSIEGMSVWTAHQAGL